MAKNCMKLSFLFIALARKFRDFLLGFWAAAAEELGGAGEAIGGALMEFRKGFGKQASFLFVVFSLKRFGQQA